MASNFALQNIHPKLQELKQFCLRIGKKPYIHDGTKNTFTSVGWSVTPPQWLAFAEAIAAAKPPYDGIGWLTRRAEDQILGGDLDCCRDPETGMISSWAVSDINAIRPFYTEISQTGSGLRYFVFGNMESEDVKGYGPQDDISDEMKAHILKVKPDAKKFNGFELYASGRHLALTGDRIDEYCFEIENRTDAITSIIKPFLPEGKKSNKKNQSRNARDRKPGLPDLNILDVIDTTGFKQDGGQLFGPHPIEGSTTGHNLVVNPSKNVYSYMHNGLKVGGNAWNWLACECGAVPWEQDGKGALNSPVIMVRVKKYAISKGFVTAEQVNLVEEIKAKPEDYVTVVGKMKVYDEYGEETGEELPKWKLSPSKASEQLIEIMTLGRANDEDGPNPNIWEYDGIKWVDDGKDIIERKLRLLLGDLAVTNNIKETCSHTLARSKKMVFDQNPYLMPCEDGVIDLETKIRDHQPEDGLTFTYNGKCKVTEYDLDTFIWYLATTYPDIRDCLTVIDLITKIAIRTAFDSFVILIGGGANGKGILEKLIIALFGMGRGSAVKVHEIHKSIFANGSLLGMDYWIITEVQDVDQITNLLKSMATGEMIDSDVKYKGRKKGYPYLLVIIDTNKGLDFKDATNGRKRKTIKLDHPFTFGEEPGMRPMDKDLLDKLKTPASLAGIIQLIRARAPSLIKSKTIYERKSKDQQEAESSIQRFHAKSFTNDCLTTLEAVAYDPLDPQTKPQRLKTTEVYAEYLEYCKLHNVPDPLDKNPFAKYMTEVCGSESISTRENGVQYRYYPGLYLVKSAKAAYAEFCLSYSKATGDYIKASGKLQDILSKIDNDNNIASAASGEQGFLTQTFLKLEAMYKYVHSNDDPKKLNFFSFLSAI